MAVAVVGMRQALRQALRLARSQDKSPTDDVVQLSDVTSQDLGDQETPPNFLKRMNSRSLAVVMLKDESPEGLESRRRYAKLLSRMPQSTYEKFDVENFSEQEAAVKISKLVALHSGEVVELDRDQCTWTLHLSTTPGSASVVWTEQFYCLNDGARVAEESRRETNATARRQLQFEMGYHVTDDRKMVMDIECKRVAATTGIEPGALLPNWDEQKLRIVVPCRGTQLYEWRRGGPVGTLGELMLKLGEEYDAAQIYYFYRTLRLVALKRRKDKPGAVGIGQALPATGMRQAGVSAGVIRRGMQVGSVRIVEEYMALMHSDVDVPAKGSAEFNATFEQALRYLHVLLLEDLRPPWLLHSFPQALPGDSMLSNLTRPTLMYWDETCAWKVFGKEVENILTHMAQVVSTVVAGVLARPLYVCTQKKQDGNVCLQKAAMSPLVKERFPRRNFMCTGCKASALPVSDSIALRFLQLYIVVKAGEPQPDTCLRTDAFRVLVTAPPDSWLPLSEREIGGMDNEEVEAAPSRMPCTVSGKKINILQFTQQESDRIWLAARSFQGNATEATSASVVDPSEL
jgi:hypothetical protein